MRMFGAAAQQVTTTNARTRHSRDFRPGRRGIDVTFAVRCVTGSTSTVLTVAGTVDRGATPRLRAALQEAVRAGVPIIVDLRSVRTIDRAALAALAAAHRQAERRRIPMLLRTAPAATPYLLAQLGIPTEESR
jgi:anti-anti-sigma factor